MVVVVGGRACGVGGEDTESAVLLVAIVLAVVVVAVVVVVLLLVVLIGTVVVVVEEEVILGAVMALETGALLPMFLGKVIAGLITVGYPDEGSVREGDKGDTGQFVTHIHYRNTFSSKKTT